MYVPDSIDPIIGWRVWKYGELLGSLNHVIPVVPRVPQVGQCHALHAHEAPDPNCSCGIYALRSLEAAKVILREQWPAVMMGMHILPTIAIGQVYLWGKVVEHEEGYRAEFAYPKSVSAAGLADSERLAKLYNIEVEYSCNWEQFLESDELNYWTIPNPFWNPSAPAPILFGISRSAPQTASGATITAESSKPSKPGTIPEIRNRSVPRQLRALVKQKEENAKSDFWKRL